MKMRICVKLWRGEWKKNAEQEWHFHPDEDELGTRVMIGEDETYASIESMVRTRYSLRESTPPVLTFRLPSWMLSPVGYKTPPTTITSTEDLCVLLNVRTSISDLALLITVGPKRVAEYEFLCRSSFTIGTTTYVVDNTQTEEDRADYERLVYGDREKETQKVMDALFSERSLMLFHRVTCEMAFADQNQPRRQTNNVGSTELIVLVDDDDVMYDASNFNLHTGGTSIGVGGSNPGPSNLVSNQNPNAEAPPIFWEVGMDMVNYTTQANTATDQETMVNNMRFWEGVLFAGIQVDDALNINEPVQDEMENVGAILSGGPVNENAVGGSVEMVLEKESQKQGNVRGSSSGSTKNSVPVLVNEGDNVAALVTSAPSTLDVTSTGGERGVELQFLACSGGPPEHGRNISGLFNITQGGPSSEPSNVGKLEPCRKETSSEESATYEENGDIGGEVAVGMVFSSREAFRQHMDVYAITRKFRYKCAKSEPGLMSLECSTRTCPWRVYAVKLKDADVFEVRKVIPEHRCTIDDRGGYETQATTAVIGEILRTKFGPTGAGPRPREIRQMMRGDLDVNISYWKAWRSRDVAMENTKETDITSYAKLPDYLNKLVKANPGTVVEMYTLPHEEGGHRFKYLFVAFAASIKGYEFMRKVVVVDGTHLKGKYGGCLLTASAQDGNYQIFPLAFAVVDGENDLSWEWFLRQLDKFVHNSEELVFVSDRHPSIFKAVSNVFPSAGHCICIIHLKRNIRSNFKGRQLEYLVAKAARCFRLQEFYETFNQIKGIDHKCAEYLVDIGLHHWARAHFKGNRYNVMTSNLAESWNGVLREAREQPIIRLVEFIRSKLMTWFATRRDQAHKNKSNSELTPKVLGLLTKNFEVSGGYEVLKIAEKEYEVREKEGGGFHVNLQLKTCSCFQFQMLAMPCSHAIAAALKEKIGVETLVAPAYGLSKLRAAYGGSIFPLEGFKGVADLVANLNGLHIYPPPTRRPPGRPKKQRFFSRGEKVMKGICRRKACSRCKKLGHNKATCKEPI